MPRPTKGDRANGPYRHGPGRSLVRFYRAGASTARVYSGPDHEARARRDVTDYNRAVAADRCTVSLALDRYDADQRCRGNADRTVATTRGRLDALLDDALDRPITDLTPARARRLLDDWRTRKTRLGAVPAPDTVLNVVGQARTFGRWLLARSLVRRDPFAGVRLELGRQPGKEQLTLDEIRRLRAAAIAEADAGEPAAIAVLILLYFGIRASEVVERRARDLDDGGRLLRVRRLKKRGRVVVESLYVDDDVRPYLAQLVADADPATGELFAGRSRHWVAHHCRRLCRVAGVPVVGPHAVRGSLGSALVEVGAHRGAVRDLYGHDDQQVTDRHYVRGEVAAQADQRAKLRLLKGGRR